SSDFCLFLIAVCFPFIIFLCYAYGYCSHKLYKAGTVVFDYQKDVPTFLFLVCRFVLQALRKTRGQLYDNDLLARNINQLTFTFYNCRLEPNNLRWYCSAFGYGWDYPDSSFRDIPLCYPEVLFFRLLAMIVCSEEFRLSPLGLTNVRKIMRTLQPIDELKKGPFSLQASVREYRTVEVGIEVDIALDVTDRASKPVWAGLVTLLSRDTKKLNKWQPACGSHEPKEVKTIELNVPWYTGLKCAYASWNYNPHHLFSSITKLLGYKHPTVHSLWMISRC
uniref:Si:ch211-12e13.1 n=3 Tax=Lepisosteus oculatus TaxID=7918 RepID=W5M4J3_LEPOC